MPAGYAVVVTTGGTGLNPNDHTPEQTRAVLDREVPQLAAAIARYGVEHGVPTAVLSRGVAGVAGRTVVVNLPGSSGGARDGMAVARTGASTRGESGAGWRPLRWPVSPDPPWPRPARAAALGSAPLAGDAAHGAVVLAPLRHRDGGAWERVRRENAEWLRPWEATLPPGSELGPATYAGLVRSLTQAGPGRTDAALAGLVRAEREPGAEASWPAS